jgi:hypothetical protein
MSTATYAIDPELERIMPLSDVPAFMERMGFRRPHLNVVRRWKQRGVRGIPLPTLLNGPRLYTSREAIKWWLQVTTAASRVPAAAAAASAADVRFPLTADDQRTLQSAGLL